MKGITIKVFAVALLALLTVTLNAGNPGNKTVITKKIEMGKEFRLSVQKPDASFTYSWYKNDEEIKGANGPELVKPTSEMSDAASYYCRISNMCGEAWTNTVDVVILIPASKSRTDEAEAVAGGYFLWQNEPNPVNDVCKIRFMVPEPTYIRLVISDIFGREIAVVKDGNVAAGAHVVEFDASKLNLANGSYLYSLVANNYSQTKTLVIVK